jgi:acetate kinase
MEERPRTKSGMLGPELPRIFGGNETRSAMNVLAINCGSTSLKFRLAGVDSNDPDAGQASIASGTINGIGSQAEVDFRAEPDGRLQETRAVDDLGAGVRVMLDWLQKAVVRDAIRIDAVGHRIVHGGERFNAPTRINAATLAGIESLEELAPLHNAPALAAVRAVNDAFGDSVPSVATFDTTFHRTMPARAATYALPLDLMEKHGIRRYGFHGLAHRSMVQRYATLRRRPLEQLRMVTLQLGGGCSITAIDKGRSVDTSMGFTPLEGLMMATRSGNLDPSLPAFLARREHVDAEVIDQVLNTRSGLLGVSGRSGDVRVLLRAEAEGDARSALALDIFCYRARKAIGAFLAALNGADAVVFGGGVGEHQPGLRARICAGLEFCGLALDPERNGAAVAGEAQIGAGSSAIDVYVIPSDEEAMIVSDTVSALHPRG